MHDLQFGLNKPKSFRKVLVLEVVVLCLAVIDHGFISKGKLYLS